MVDMIGQLLASRYEIIRVLGAGGFSQTYVARDTHIPGNPTCVVKHLKPASTSPSLLATARQLFQREAETLVKLGKHEQIPQLLAYFEEDEEFYLVQEFIEGETLATELPPGERWQEEPVMQLLEEILDILVFVHSQGVIHRDIKPDNIIRRAWDNKLVLIDFGAIKQVQSQQLSTVEQEQTVATSTRIGTPGYSPTEQDRGKPRPSSDIYALGMIGVQALTGVYPDQFQEDDETGELIWQHQAQVSSELAAILTKMVRYHFKDRYQSAEEALLALQLLKNSSPTPTVPATVADRITDSIVDRVTHTVHEGHELILEWVEGEKLKTQPIRENQPSKNPGTVRLGRDPAVCDIVLSEPTVSGLHAEIFFNPEDKNFYLRSLRESNPPIVDRQPVPTGEVVLHQGSNLRLGELALRVIAIEFKPLPQVRKYTPTQIVQQVTTPSQPVAPTRQLPAAPTTRRNTASSSSENQVVEKVSTPADLSKTTSNSRLPFLIGLGMATLLTVGGAYAYVQSQSNNTAAKNTLTTNSDSTLKPTPTDLPTPDLNSTLPTIPTDLPTTDSNPTRFSIPADLPIGNSDSTITSRRRDTSITNSQTITSRPRGTSTENSEVTPKPNSTDTSTEKSEATPKPSPTETSTPKSDETKPSRDDGASILTKATDKAKSDDFQGAIALAEQIPSSSAAYQQAQKAIAQWQEQQQKAAARKESETLAKSLLAQAAEIAKKGGESDLETAIKLAEKAMAEAPADSTVYKEAQNAIAQWQREVETKREQEPAESSYVCSCQSDDPNAQNPPASTQSQSDLTGSTCTASDAPESSAVGVWKCEKK